MTLRNDQITNATYGGSLIGGTGLASAIPGSAWAAAAQNIPGASLVAQRTPLMTMGVASMPAALGLAAYSHAMNRGELMDKAAKKSNSELARQMQEIRDASKYGFVVNDEGEYINTNPYTVSLENVLNQNDLNKFNTLAAQREKDELAWQIRDNAAIRNMDEEEAAEQIATLNLLNSSEKPKQVKQAEQKTVTKGDVSGNWMDSLTGLLGLLALGGGAYYLGKKL